jgi:hypothetical protein
MILRQVGGSHQVVALQLRQVLDLAGEGALRCRFGLGALDLVEVLRQGAAADCFLDSGGQGIGRYSDY